VNSLVHEPGREEGESGREGLREWRWREGSSDPLDEEEEMKWTVSESVNE